MECRSSCPPSLGDARHPEPGDHEVRYRLFVRSLADYAIALLDADGRVLSWNRGAERTTGYSEEEVRGRHLGALFAEDAAGRRVDRQLRVARNRGRFREERWRFRRDGTRFWSHEVLIPLRDADRRVIGYARISRDCTERKREADTQRFLAEAGDILASSLDYATTLQNVVRLGVPRLADCCAIGVVDDGDVRAVEFAAADPEKEAVLRELLRRSPPGRYEAGHPLGRALRTGEAQVLRRITNGMIEALIPDDPRCVALVRRLAPRSAVIAPMVARGRVLGLMVAAMAESGRIYDPADPTPVVELADRAALAIDNARLYGEARDAVRVRDEIHGIVAHDLRSPLNTISTVLRMLRQRVSAADGPEGIDDGSIGIAERAAAQMERLIRDMVDVGRIEDRGMRLECAPEPTAAIIDEAVRLHRDVAADRSVELRGHAAPDLPAVSVDRGRILQVLSNLIDNSLKFTPAHGRVVVGAEQTGRGVRCWVSDNGSGIPDDERNHLFERFWQARRSGRAGAGLGLAICKGIVEAHGGRLWVESAVGAGSTFSFTLPGDA